LNDSLVWQRYKHCTIKVKGWSGAMRETSTFDHHAEHAWLHFTIRLFIVALLIFLFLVLTEGSFGHSLKQNLSQAEVWEAEQ